MMKKIVMITLLVLFAASIGYADQVTATNTLTIGGGADLSGTASDTLTMGLSNNVTACYEDGDVTQSQWYAIATSHLGGKQVYGTAQDMTSLFKLVTEKDPGTPGSFDGMPADSTASSDWSSGVWEAL